LRNTVFILLLIMTLLFTACWDALDINAKDLTTAVVVDKIGEDYAFIVEVANLAPKKTNGEKGESEDENYSIVDSKGKTFADARANLDNKLDKPIFLGTVRMLVLTENMAKEGVGEYLYRLRNLYEYRKALNIVTTSSDPENLLELQKGSPVSAGHTIEDILNKLYKTGNTIETSASDALEKLSSEHTCFLLPDINIIGEAIALTGYSVIHDSYYIDQIPITETKGINFILNDKVECIYVVPFKDHRATVDVELKKKKITPFYKNKKISFRTEFELDGLVKYLDINDGFDEESQREVEKNLKQMIEKDINSAILKSQKEIECDYLDFDEVFRIKFPNEYEKMDWYKAYLDSYIEVNIELELDPGGDYDYNPEIKR